MKASPHCNFPISVRKQIWEEEVQVAVLYQDIFDVTLNFTTSIMLVPNLFQVIQSGCIPTLPKDIDKITTEMEARLVTVGLSKYVVTPDTKLAGTEIVVENIIFGDSEMIVLFYVTDEEFDNFVVELSNFAEQSPFVYNACKVSEIRNFEFVKLLLSRIIPSAHFSTNDLYMLGKEKSI